MESFTQQASERCRELEITAARTFESCFQRSTKAGSIGDVPDIADPERRAPCRRDFKLYCTSYFPEIFYLPWSDDQLRCVDKIEEVIPRGGLFALAMPRGSGKAALCQTAVVWAQAILPPFASQRQPAGIADRYRHHR